MASATYCDGEKVEAMVVLGQRNSRIKDFFDVHHLAVQREFESQTLAESVRRTFRRRETPLPEEEPVALTAAYWEDPARVAQIRAFARRSGIFLDERGLTDLVGVLRAFLLPLLADARDASSPARVWPAGGPWRSRS